MLLLNLTDAHRALTPIIVTSPTARCGTTLVQRLLTSANNAFIYGEEIGLHIRHLSEWLLAKMTYLQQNEDRFGAEFQQALNGKQRDWRPGLPPPPQILLQAYLDTFSQVPIALQGFSASIERPLWGFKCPGLSPDTIRLLFTLMPGAKVVYVYRDLAEALRSAKARKFVDGGEETVDFCKAWRDNFGGALEQADQPRLLLLDYARLCAEPAASVAELAAFTGATAIDAGEFDLKVNTFVGEPAEGRSPTQYVDPADLSPEESHMATAYAEPVLARLAGLRPERG